MILLEKIPLPNLQTIEVWDLSRPVATDTTKVELFMNMKIDIHPSYLLQSQHYERVIKVFGSELFFEHRRERTYVKNHEKDAVLHELLASFKKDMIPYLSKPMFPKSFALSKVRDIEKNRYKYSWLFEESPS